MNKNVDPIEVVDNYINESTWWTKENSNVGKSFSGLANMESSIINARYWLDKVYAKDKQIGLCHRNGDFHLHDLSQLTSYCCGWSLREILEQGLGGIPEKVSSGPAKHLSVAIQQIINFIGLVSQEQAGAQAISSFDTYLAPFIKIEKLSREEVKQCMQSFLFNINISSRFGGQPPFSNITLDIVPPKDLIDRHPIIGGVEQDFTYRDCQEEMNLLNECYLETVEEGDENQNNFAYPILTINVTKKFQWDTPIAERIFRIASKYGTPYFSNFISSDLDESDIRSMCLARGTLIPCEAEEDLIINDDGTISKVS